MKSVVCQIDCQEVKGPMKAHACLINVQKHEHCEILLDLGWIGFWHRSASARGGGRKFGTRFVILPSPLHSNTLFLLRHCSVHRISNTLLRISPLIQFRLIEVFFLLTILFVCDSIEINPQLYPILHNLVRFRPRHLNALRFWHLSFQILSSSLRLSSYGDLFSIDGVIRWTRS